MRLLASHGANIHKADVDSWTPLHAAAANGHADIARYLMGRGADTQAATGGRNCSGSGGWRR